MGSEEGLPGHGVTVMRRPPGARRALHRAPRPGRAAGDRVPHAVFTEDDPMRTKAMYQAACGIVSELSPGAGSILKSSEAGALAHLDFPATHRRRIRTNNVQERLNREIKRRREAVPSFPTEASLVRLVGAVCCEACEEWSARRYMDQPGVEKLRERASRPLPDPEPEQVGRARSRIVALAGLNWLGEAA